MIDIALSNRNSQMIQSILENHYEKLYDFAIENPDEQRIAKKLIGHMLSEHANVKSAELE